MILVILYLVLGLWLVVDASSGIKIVSKDNFYRPYILIFGYEFIIGIIFVLGGFGLYIQWYIA